VRCVEELAQPERARALELYAGHGNLTFALASAASLVAIESDAAAVDALRAQLLERGFPHVQVRCADAAEGARGGSPVDVAVLDPPRSGARAAIAALLKRNPARIVYVSCDLATLERDLRALTDACYRVDRALAFDMFPQTAHLESVVRLQRTEHEPGPGEQA
jgi:23S rRNA (uracil1939-C5)-methyltransferase